MSYLNVDEIDMCKVEQPEFTKTWHPHSHETIINSIQKAVTNRGFEVYLSIFN